MKTENEISSTLRSLMKESIRRFKEEQRVRKMMVDDLIKSAGGKKISIINYPKNS